MIVFDMHRENTPPNRQESDSKMEHPIDSIRHGHEQAYKIHDMPMGSRRPIRVVCIGAGYSGLMMSIVVSQKMQDHNIEFQIYEMNCDLGGTWLTNRQVPLVEQTEFQLNRCKISWLPM